MDDLEEQKGISPTHATSSFVQHFIAIVEFKLGLQSGNAPFGENRRFFVPCDLEIRRMTLTKKGISPMLL